MINRRGFLSMMPIAPLAAGQAAANTVQGMAHNVGLPTVEGLVKVSETRLITDFAEYLKTDEAADLWANAVRDASGQLDPDIAGHRSWSPYQKLRAQAQRNYRVNIAARKTWFDRLVAKTGGWEVYD